MGDLEWWSQEQQHQQVEGLEERQYDDDIPDDISIGADIEMEQLKYQQKPQFVQKQHNYQNKQSNSSKSPITKDTYSTTSNPKNRINNNSAVVPLPPILVTSNTNHQQQRFLTTKTPSKSTNPQLFTPSGNKNQFIIDPYDSISSKREQNELQQIVNMPTEKNNISRMNNNSHSNSRSMTKNEVGIEDLSLSSRIKLMNYQGRVNQGNTFGDEDNDDDNYDGQELDDNDYDGEDSLGLNKEFYKNNNEQSCKIPSQVQPFYQQQQNQQFSRNNSNFNEIENNSVSSMSIGSCLNVRNPKKKNQSNNNNSITMLTEQPTITAKSKQQQIQQQLIPLNCSDSPSATIVYGEQHYQTPLRGLNQSSIEENNPQFRNGTLRRQDFLNRKVGSSRKRYFSVLDEQTRQQQIDEQEQDYYERNNRNDTANSMNSNSNNYIKSLSPKFKHQNKSITNANKTKPQQISKQGIRVNSLPSQPRSISLRASRQTPLNNRLVVATIGANQSTVAIKNHNSQSDNKNNNRNKKQEGISQVSSPDKFNFSHGELSGLFEEKDYLNMNDSAIEEDNSILEMYVTQFKEQLAQQHQQSNIKGNRQNTQVQQNQFYSDSLVGEPRRHTVASCKISNPRFYELDIKIGYNKKYQNELQIESDKVTQRAELISDPSYIFNLRQQIASAQKVLADLKIQVKVKEGQKKELEQAMYQIMSRKQISVEIMNVQDIRMRLQGLQMKMQMLLNQQAQFNDDAMRMKLEMQVKKDQQRELAEMAEKMHIPMLKQSESTHRTLNNVCTFTSKIQTLKFLKEKLSILHRNYTSIEKHMRFREEQLQKELHEYKLMVRESTDNEWIFDNAIKSNQNRIEGLMWDAGIQSISVNEDQDGNYKFSFVMKTLSERRREIKMEQEEKEMEQEKLENELFYGVDNENKEVRIEEGEDYEEDDNRKQNEEEENQNLGKTQDNQEFLTQIPVNIIEEEKIKEKQEIPQDVSVSNQEEHTRKQEDEENLNDLETQQHDVQAFPTIRNSIQEEIVGYCRSQDETEEKQETRRVEVDKEDELSQVKEEIVDEELVCQQDNNRKEQQILEKVETKADQGDTFITNRVSKVRVSEDKNYPRNNSESNEITRDVLISSKIEPKGEQRRPRRYGPLMPDPFEKESKVLITQNNQNKDTKVEAEMKENEVQNTQISQLDSIINKNNNNNNNNNNGNNNASLTNLLSDNLSPQTVSDSPPRLFNLSRKKHNNLNNNNNITQSPLNRESLLPPQSPIISEEAPKLNISPKISIRDSSEIIPEQPFDLEKQNPSTFVEKQVSDGYHFLGPRERLTRKRQRVGQNQEEMVSPQKKISGLQLQQISYAPTFQVSEQNEHQSSQSPVSNPKTNEQISQGIEEKQSSSFLPSPQKQDLDGTNKDKDIAASFNAAFLQDMYGQKSKQKFLSNVTEF